MSNEQSQTNCGPSHGYAFFESKTGIDLDSIAETDYEVRRKVLEASMGWRFEHPDRYSHEEEWQRLLQYGRIVKVSVSIENA